jgi:hypothetical protein
MEHLSIYHVFVGAQNDGSGGQNFTAIEMRFGFDYSKGTRCYRSY